MVRSLQDCAIFDGWSCMIFKSDKIVRIKLANERLGYGSRLLFFIQ